MSTRWLQYNTTKNKIQREEIHKQNICDLPNPNVDKGEKRKLQQEINEYKKIELGQVY